MNSKNIQIDLYLVWTIILGGRKCKYYGILVYLYTYGTHLSTSLQGCLTIAYFCWLVYIASRAQTSHLN